MQTKSIKTVQKLKNLNKLSLFLIPHASHILASIYLKPHKQGCSRVAHQTKPMVGSTRSLKRKFDLTRFSAQEGLDEFAMAAEL